MATVIRLQRGGRKKRPFYSIVVMDSRNRRDGAFIEKLGYYDPLREPARIELDLERVQAWTDVGARLSPRVASLVKRVEAAAVRPRPAPSPDAEKGGAPREEAPAPEAAASPPGGEEAAESGPEASAADESEEGKEEARA